MEKKCTAFEAPNGREGLVITWRSALISALEHRHLLSIFKGSVVRCLWRCLVQRCHPFVLDAPCWPRGRSWIGSKQVPGSTGIENATQTHKAQLFSTARRSWCRMTIGWLLSCFIFLTWCHLMLLFLCHILRLVMSPHTRLTWLGALWVIRALVSLWRCDDSYHVWAQIYLLWISGVKCFSSAPPGCISEWNSMQEPQWGDLKSFKNSFKISLPLSLSTRLDSFTIDRNPYRFTGTIPMLLEFAAWCRT